MSEKQIHVEIVAPVHNRREVTLQCLRSLSRIDRTGLKVHIIIVDDGSTDGTSEAIREQFPEVEIVQEDGSLWYTAGTNRGIEAALEKNPDYVLAINDDSVFDDKFLRLMVSCAEENPQSVVGPLLLLWDRPHQVFQVAPRWRTWYGGWHHSTRQTVWTMPREAWDVEVIVGNCILLPIAAIKRFGLMDAKRFPHYGDAEYTVRMRKNGWRLLIEPRARIFCQPNALPPTLHKQSLKKLLEMLFFNEKSIHSLSKRWLVNWTTAPSRMQGALAFAVFLGRLGLKTVGLAGRWPNDWPEEPPTPTRSPKLPADSKIKNVKQNSATEI
ncbi:MAG: glycosyltransferase family 2 protein [Pyrinomonadaceae bacterium]|nr:glycosyltransferase family 2 protein [Pyrinomonadaceae bacterium]